MPDDRARGQGMSPADPPWAAPYRAALALLEQGDAEAGLAALRLIPTQLAPRSVAVAATRQLSGLDPAFQALVRRGDAARDAADWAEGEACFGAALQLYPLHPSYMVQYAHCLKEQGRFPQAEAWYRSALALGEDPAMVEEHLRHAFAQAGGGAAEFRLPASPAGEAALRCAPTKADIDDLFWLLLRRAPEEPAETLALLRHCRDRQEVFRRIVEAGEFPARNRELMTMLAQTAG